MKSKLPIYILPIFLSAFLFYSFSTSFEPTETITGTLGSNTLNLEHNYASQSLTGLQSVIPIIEDVEPGLNEINVSKSSNLAVTFNTNEMNPATFNNSTVKVFGSQTGKKNCNLVWDLLLKKLFINPDSDFKIGEKINVSLTNGIKTLDNNPIIPFTWSFTVQALSGTGIFSETSRIDSANLNTSQPTVVTHAADFDNDGDIDLITDGYFTGAHIYKNGGGGVFTLSQVINGLPNVEHYSGLCLGDFDSDGDVDFVYAVATNTPFIANILTYSNDGSGNFTQTALSIGGGIIGATGDLDGDGDLDVVMSWAFSKVRYCLNDGNGNFTNYELTGFGYFHSNGCDIGDIDNDGDIDIMLSIKNDIPCKIVMLENDGNANFSLCSEYFTLSYYSTQKFADIDGDQKLDLTGANYIYNNDDSCLFTQTSISAGSLVMPFDFEGDGDIDLAYSNSPSNDVKLFSNNGSGSFTNTSTVILGSYTIVGATGDFDNDGDIDFTINNPFGESGSGVSYISILKNGGCSGPLQPVLAISNFELNGVPQPPGSLTCGGSLPMFHHTDVATFDITITDDGQPGGQVTVLAPVVNLTPPDCKNITYTYNGGVAPFPIESHNPVVLGVRIARIDGNLCIGSINFRAHDDCPFQNTASCGIILQNPLPVELSSFTSIVTGNDVSLNWSTSTETNNSGFEIERSNSNSAWNKVGFVEGSGNSTTPISYSFTERNLNSGSYSYRLKQIDFNGNFEYFNLSNEVNIGTPVEFSLNQNYPNPFNPSTKIEFALPKDGFVSLAIFDNSGREVSRLVNENRSSGYYSASFNGSGLSSGIYFYRLEVKGSENFVQVRKMMLVK